MRNLLPVLLLLCACAPALPAWSGGSTTPQRRGDVLLGTAVRVPLGKLRRTENSALREAAEEQGLTPVGAFRYGFGRGPDAPQRDLGVMVAANHLRLTYRSEFGVTEGATRSAYTWGVALLGGVLPESGPFGDYQGSGMRFGFDVPLTWGADFGGLYDAWAGVSIGGDHAFGDYEITGASGAGVSEAASATTLRASAFFGLSGGFRRLHFFGELRAAYEYTFASHGEQDLDRGGVVLTPSFGMRLRI